MRGLTLLLPLSALVLSGCATTPSLRDRVHDARDVFTATYGTGIGGIKMRIGPIGTGIFHEFPQCGLRGGDFLSPYKMVDGGKIPNGDFQLLVIGGEGFFGTTNNMMRYKSYSARMLAGINIPAPLTEQEDFPVTKIAELQRCTPEQIRSSKLAYLTQIEIAGGLIGTIRIGFNIGELLDFILGWIGIDIASDDIEVKNEEIEQGNRAYR